MILLFFLFSWLKALPAHSFPSACLRFQNFDPVLEEIAYHDMKRMSNGIVDLYKYNCDTGTNGGINIAYIDLPLENAVGTTNKTLSYNVKNEEIIVWQVIVNKRLVEQQQETNKIYAFKNAVYHEVFCHALTNGADHTAFGLCKSRLSTDKVYWGKQHKRNLRRLLFTDFKTGNILNI
jgi:hypothetical protein